ncbi:hypothetical protein BJY14_006531 [Actinomadura luteofluorescens]|uniref:Uncharacterized protein n=1 Tax=Actinomadura luteofluorescens TaxID=46163 RepID=A0A7Y9EMK2_9ACTN|nr:hypothetical protein [Actinomadura luteofluorescens]
MPGTLSQKGSEGRSPNTRAKPAQQPHANPQMLKNPNQKGGEGRSPKQAKPVRVTNPQVVRKLSREGAWGRSPHIGGLGVAPQKT